MSFPDSIFAIVLLHSANVSNFERVPILSVAASNAFAELKFKLSDKIIDTVQYKCVPSIIRQLDLGASSSVQSSEPN